MSDRPSSPSAVGLPQLLQIGATCGVCIGLGMLVGYLLDNALGTAPLLVFVGLTLGIVGAAAGSYWVIRPFVTDGSDGSANPKE
jgi:F0F1-type ATP synthase assembly protein I